MTGATEADSLNISVVIPALDAEAYLPALLMSIEAQTLAPAEIVIVDSSRSSRTAELLERWSGTLPIVYKRVSFAYPGHARNLGAQLARGNWIAFIDCRTIPAPEWLETCASSISDTGAVFVGGLCVSDADTGFTVMLRAATYGQEAWKTLPGSLVLKSVFDQSGGFTSNVRAGEDLDWMDRISTQAKSTIAPVATIRYSGFPETLAEAVRKWYVYAIANATIEVRNNHKTLYLGILIFLILFISYRWNATFAPEISSTYYLPNVTKISMACIAILYLAYRGIIRPLSVKVELSYLLPWRWLAIGFIALCLDLAKAPGLIWGALLLLNRRVRAAWAGSGSERGSRRNLDRKVVDGFGDEWSRFDQTDVSEAELFELYKDYFAIFPWAALPPKAEGFDMGCGSGRWAKLVAPQVGKLNCIEPSEQALAVAQRNLSDKDNCAFYCASVDDCPLPESSQDFGYCLGVLHHVPDPLEGLTACVSKLRPGAPFLIYLYYALDNRPWWFKLMWRISDGIREIICHLPYAVRYAASQGMAVLVYWPLSRIARLLESAGFSVSNFPLSYYRNRSFYTLRTDALDRFGTRLEKRFSRGEIFELMKEAGLVRIAFSEKAPFWCAVGYRPY